MDGFVEIQLGPHHAMHVHRGRDPVKRPALAMASDGRGRPGGWKDRRVDPGDAGTPCSSGEPRPSAAAVSGVSRQELLTRTLCCVIVLAMRAVTIREAKARLNELVEAAIRGEQVVLMRGSKHVAALVPVSTEELELPARLSDPQAERLWRHLASGLRDGSSLVFETPEAAVAHLSGKRSRRAGATRRRPTPS